MGLVEKYRIIELIQYFNRESIYFVYIHFLYEK
jgi:hypothetical protein